MLAPSAVNKQPWRIVVCGNEVHFYEKHGRGYSSDNGWDVQKIDMGIALCHFELVAKECGLHYLMYYALSSSEGINIGFSPNIQFYLAATLAVFVIILLSLIYSADKIKNDNIIESLKQD